MILAFELLTVGTDGGLDLCLFGLRVDGWHGALIDARWYRGYGCFIESVLWLKTHIPFGWRRTNDTHPPRRLC